MESGEMDLLSKQAILSLPRDVEKSLDGKILDEYINVKDIEALPTVQSQSTAGQLNDSAQSTNLIDRQQAIDAIHCNIVVTGRENAELVAKTMGEFVDRIKALPTIQPVATDTNVGDTISRQWLLECINDGWIKFDTDKDANRFIHLVRDIAPTIQPEKRTEKRTETHACDLISRQAAIDALGKLHKEDIEDYGCEIPEGFNQDNLDRAIFAIKQLPTVQPEVLACGNGELVAKPEPHWIPCEERMPEEHEWIGTKKFGTTISDEVYVTFENEKGERFCQHMKFQNGELSRYDQFHMDTWFKGSKPIAWMPLPKPFEGGTE